MSFPNSTESGAISRNRAYMRSLWEGPAKPKLRSGPGAMGPTTDGQPVTEPPSRKGPSYTIGERQLSRTEKQRAYRERVAKKPCKVDGCRNVAAMRHLWILPEPLHIGWFQSDGREGELTSGAGGR